MATFGQPAERRSAEYDLVTRAVADNHAALALLRTPDFSLQYANRAHSSMFGGDSGSGEGAPEAVPAELRQAAATVLATGQPAQTDLPVDDRFVHSVCSPVRTGEGVTAVSVVSIDVTDQVRARQHAERRHQRLSVLDEATSAVTAETDPYRELVALAEGVVPALADACAVYLVDRSARRVGQGPLAATRLICVLNPALGLPPPAPEVRLRLAPTRPVARASQNREPVVATGADPADWGEHWLAVLNPHSLLAMPIGPDSVQAVISIAVSGSRPPFEASDIALMREITNRVEQAVGQALRMQQTSEVALTLQRGLLSEPPHVPGLDIRVHYRPAGPGLEVGGDWYDAFLHPGGDLALTVGDVVGHDLYAASTMGQLRSMVQALACQRDADPGTVLTSLNDLTHHLGVGELASVIHGRLVRPSEPGSARFTWANAGHPPPLLIGPDQGVQVLEYTASPLLGLDRAPYPQVTVEVPAGAVLLLYTDGLVEDPRRPSADAIAELAEAARKYATLGLDELCEQLIAGAAGRDDIALLAVRVEAPGTTVGSTSVALRDRSLTWSDRPKP